MHAESLHKLLTRQLRRHFGSLEAVPVALHPFLEVVDRAYRQSDEDRALMEHSLETVSAQLADRLQRIAAVTDEREQVQVALSQLEATIESTADGVLVLDQSGRIQRANQAALRMWHAWDAAAPEAVPVDLLDRLQAELSDHRDLRASLAGPVTTPEGAVREELRTRQGRVIEWQVAPQRVDSQVVGWVWNFRDITDRLQLQEQLRQSQKMEAIGQLAGGVAHDFNNLLTVIDGNVELAVTAPDLPLHLQELLREVRGATARAAQLTSQLLAFSRKQTLRSTVFDLADTVTGLTPMLRRSIGPTMTLEMHTHPAHVRADRGQLDQVLLNLVINARDAMGGQGIIRIGSGTRDVTAPLQAVQGDRIPAGRYAVLSVSDNGPGIPEILHDRIFEPFFTTKAPGEGTGLGLAMVYGLARQSGGYVLLESREGQGTRLEILLPVHAPSAPAAAAMATPERVPEVLSRRVLVVDDEDAVRRLVSAVLERQGYAVRQAPNGREALALLHTGVEFDLVVSDVIMPEMGGRELGRHLRTLHPQLPVLFMSGYSHEEMDVQGGMLEEGLVLLPKPFNVGQLLKAVRAMLP